MNLLHTEYRQELSRLAALHGADRGALIQNDQATWTSPLGSASVTIELVVNPREHGSAVPAIGVGSSSTLPSDVLLALALLHDAQATIHRALGAWASLQGIVVWFDAAPCDACGAKGRDRGTPCVRCNGSGKRTSAS